MDFKSKDAEMFVPDGVKSPECYNRTTHLAIAAHQDDIEIMATDGILKCFKSAEDWFGGVVLTDGVGSARTGIYSSCDDFQMKKIRALEQKKASFVGEYSVLFMFLGGFHRIQELGLFNCFYYYSQCLFLRLWHLFIFQVFYRITICRTISV